LTDEDTETSLSDEGEDAEASLSDEGEDAEASLSDEGEDAEASDLTAVCLPLSCTGLLLCTTDTE